MTVRFQVPSEKVPQLGGRSFLFVEGQAVALFNIDGEFYAIDDSCPHQGASLFSGKLEGKVIQCCAHGLRFDLTSGCLVNSNLLKVASHPVDVIENDVFIIMNLGAKHD